MATRATWHRNWVCQSVVGHEELTPEELALQEGLDRSWAHAQKALADPVFRAHLEESIERVNRSSATPISKEEFLAQPESLIE